MLLLTTQCHYAGEILPRQSAWPVCHAAKVVKIRDYADSSASYARGPRHASPVETRTYLVPPISSRVVVGAHKSLISRNCALEQQPVARAHPCLPLIPALITRPVLFDRTTQRFRQIRDTALQKRHLISGSSYQTRVGECNAAYQPLLHYSPKARLQPCALHGEFGASCPSVGICAFSKDRRHGVEGFRSNI